MTAILLGIFGILVATAIIWFASDRLEKTAHVLAQHYGLPEVVKGTVIMAISSSFPELATVVLAGVVHGNFELGIAAIIGSAIFNILAIPGASVLASSGRFETGPNIVFREAQFYLISILVTALMGCLAVIYFPLDDTHVQGYLTWQLALLPLGFYLLYGYIQWCETKTGDAKEPPQTTKSDKIWWHWISLIIAMAFTALGVEILLKIVIEAGDYITIPSYVWGATVIAIVTSLPDLFMSIKAAQHDSADSSMGNAIGSNIFDLLVIIPLGVFAATEVLVDLHIVIPLTGFLLAATLLVIVMMRQDFKLSRGNAWWMLVSYGGFILWAFLH